MFADVKDYCPNILLGALLRDLGVTIEDAVQMDYSPNHVEVIIGQLHEDHRALDKFISKLAVIQAGHNEHVVYQSLDKKRAIKVTKPGRYGHSATKGGAKANLAEYLFRLACHNRFFAGDLVVLGCTSEKQIVISQKWISPRREASNEQIAVYMHERGFSPIEGHPDYGGQGFANQKLTPPLCVADANPPNVWVTPDEGTIAVDLIIGIHR